VAQHRSQCSIFANQQLNVSNISLCSCYLRPIAIPGFRSVADPRSSTRLQIAFTEQSFQHFPEILQQLFGIQIQVSAMSPSELYLGTIFYP